MENVALRSGETLTPADIQKMCGRGTKRHDFGIYIIL